MYCMYAIRNPKIEKKTTQINISLPQSLAVELDKMATDDGFDNRSAFLRRLIRVEIKRRSKITTQSTKA